MKTRVRLVALIVLLAGTALTAGQTPAPQPQQPTFKVQVDYVETLEGSGFKFNNPNVKSTCGCGSSFSV